MKRAVILLAFATAACFCFAWIRKAPVRPERYVGKWFISDYKIDGVTDPDCVAEIDSTTYWLHADGHVTFYRVWYLKMPDVDTARIDGTWEYLEKKDQILLHWNMSFKPKKEKWNMSGSSDHVVLKGGNREIHMQKAP